MTTPDLVPGELRGYRRFRLGPDGGLHPPVRGGPAWGAALEHARCDTGHAAPATACGCGLHAWYRSEDADGAGDVLATVLVRGRTVLGDHGVRAAAARVEAVVVRDRRARAAVAARYPAVRTVGSARRLRRDHPPEDVTGLGVAGRTSAAARSRRGLVVAWALGVAAFYVGVALAAAGSGAAPALLAGVLVGQLVLGWCAARGVSSRVAPGAGSPRPGPR